jgi:hypothetical protein
VMVRGAILALIVLNLVVSITRAANDGTEQQERRKLKKGKGRRRFGLGFAGPGGFGPGEFGPGGFGPGGYRAGGLGFVGPGSRPFGRGFVGPTRVAGRGAVANVGDNLGFYPYGAYYAGWYKGKPKPGYYWGWGGPGWGGPGLVGPAGFYGGPTRGTAAAGAASSGTFDMTTTTTISSTSADTADAAKARGGVGVVGGVVVGRKLGMEESPSRGLRGSIASESFVVGAEGE